MVLDMEKKGLVVFERELDDFTFPENGGHHTADTTEARFRRLFLHQLALKVSRNFYAYDFVEDFGPDANMNGL